VSDFEIWYVLDSVLPFSIRLCNSYKI